MPPANPCAQNTLAAQCCPSHQAPGSPFIGNSRRPEVSRRVMPRACVSILRRQTCARSPCALDDQFSHQQPKPHVSTLNFPQFSAETTNAMHLSCLQHVTRLPRIANCAKQKRKGWKKVQQLARHNSFPLQSRPGSAELANQASGAEHAAACARTTDHSVRSATPPQGVETGTQPALAQRGMKNSKNSLTESKSQKRRCLPPQHLRTHAAPTDNFLFVPYFIAPVRITNGYVWLKGVHPDYLADLPPWPNLP
jgi:hypothetical protein